MASESRGKAQETRHRQVAMHFRAFARLAREERYEHTEEITPAMQERVRQIYELHHAITLNEGW